MGSNQVKATPSPFLQVESRTLSYQDDQERIFKKGIQRRLGTDVLAQWILMKRREKELVQRAKDAVSDGKAPPDILKEVEMHVAKGSKKPHIKYHPKILTKKAKPVVKSRFKGPKLNQTAARRIQESYERRERELREASEGEASTRSSRSRVSVRSHGWTDRTPRQQQQQRKPTAKSSNNRTKQQKRASSLPPPSSTLSLQSITTTAESSGIGLSRASSMTSVDSSSRHRTFYSRQRARSLGPKEEAAAGPQKPRQNKAKTTATIGSAGMSQGAGGGTQQHPPKQQEEKPGWKHKCLAALKHSRLQRKDETRKPKEAKQKEGDTSRQMQDVESGNREIARQRSSHGQAGGDRQVHYQDSQQQTSAQSGEVEASRSAQHRHQRKEHGERQQNTPYQTERQQKEKKEQGSQTRLSGPPRPRRLLLLRPGRNKIKTSPQEDEAQAGTSNSNSSSRSNSRTDQQLERRDSSQEIQEQAVAGPSRRHSHNRISPEQPEIRPKTSLREESAAITRPATTIKKQANTIPPTPPPDYQNPQPGTSQERSKKKPSKTLDIAKRATRKWLRAASLDMGERKKKQQQNQRPDGRKLSHSESLDNLGQGDTQHNLYKDRRSLVTRQEVQVQQSSSEDVERRLSLQLRQEPQRVNTAQFSRQEPIIHIQRSIHRRSSLSVEPMSRQHSRSPVHRRSRSTDIEWQAGPSRSRDLIPNVSAEMSQVNTRQVHKASQSGTHGNDSSDYDFEDTIEDQAEVPSGNSLRHKTVEVQVEANIDRSSSLEDFAERRPRGMVDQGRCVESQGGGRRLGNFSESGRNVEVKGGRSRGGESVEIGRPSALHDNRFIQGPMERRPARASVDGIRLSQSVDLGSPEGGRRQFSLERERVRREPYMEYIRHEPTTEYSRYDVPGRGSTYGEHSMGHPERGYSVESLAEPRYIRAHSDRRYTVGPVEPSYMGSYSDRNYHGRSGEYDYTRSYNSGRPYDHDYARGYIDRGYIPGRIVEHGVYPERILTARRVKGEDEWERGGRVGDPRRYREAIIAPHSTALAAPSPPVDHRAL